MYTDAMTAIQGHLVKKTQAGGFTYTSELQPERDKNGEMYDSVSSSMALRFLLPYKHPLTTCIC
jgi:hypothetical protein